MTCGDLLPLAGNYLDGELPEEMGDRIQRHLLRCATCRGEVESLRMAVEVLKAGCTPAAPSEDFILNTLAKLAGELDITTATSGAPGQLVLGIGAGLTKDPSA